MTRTNRSHAPGGDAGPAQPLRCLLVEDSRFDRSLVHYSAERGGVEIEFVDAPTLAQARRRLESEEFGLIILDHRLPDGDGLELTAQALHRGVPTIMLSGADAEDISRASEEAGCVAFIAKEDLSPDGLAEAVRGALQRHPHATVAVATEGVGPEIGVLLGAISDASRTTRLRPLASRMMALVSEMRGGGAVSGPHAAALEEMSELCLMLWLEIAGADGQSDTQLRETDTGRAAAAVN